MTGSASELLDVSSEIIDWAVRRDTPGARAIGRFLDAAPLAWLVLSLTDRFEPVRLRAKPHPIPPRSPLTNVAS